MSVGTFAAAQLLRFVPRRRVSRAVGMLCDAALHPKLSRWVSDAYTRAFKVDLSEAGERPDPYPSFDAFFTRPLRPGARPVAAAALVSPADGQLLAKGPVHHQAQIFVKGHPYDVGELIGDDADASRYVGGQFAVVYLSPRDYHRVHAPAEGRIAFARSMEGDLFPVNAIGERHVPRLFVRNHRVAIALDTAGSGRVMVIMVGATIVGRITVAGVNPFSTPPGLHRIEPPLAVESGDEIGVFHLGSTVVLLVEPGLSIDRELGPVRYGQSLVGN